MPSLIISDIAGAALHSLIGTLIAIAARERTGKGQFVDISYADADFSMLGWDLSMYLLTGKARHRGESLQTGSEPSAAVYQTKDGEYVSIHFIEPKFWANFCNHINRPDLISRQLPETEKEKQELRAFLQQLFLTRTRDEWWEWAKDKEVMLGPVRYLEEATSDPHLLAREMVVKMDYPPLGKITQIGNPFKLAGTPPRIKSVSPLTSQHTTAILKSLGYSDLEIRELKEQRVI